jgi:hypothetical protein
MKTYKLARNSAWGFRMSARWQMSVRGSALQLTDTAAKGMLPVPAKGLAVTPGEMEPRPGTARRHLDVTRPRLAQNGTGVVNLHNHCFTTLSTSPSHCRYAIFGMHRDFLCTKNNSPILIMLLIWYISLSTGKTIESRRNRRPGAVLEGRRPRLR